MNKYCIIAIILSITSILFILFKSNNTIHKFRNSLDNEQLEKYKEIYTERVYIYVLGILLGVILSYIYIYFCNNSEYKLCKFIAIICITKIIFYYLYPKKKLMLYYLKNNNQVTLWADIYTEFKNAWIYSLIISILSYIILYYGIINN